MFDAKLSSRTLKKTLTTFDPNTYIQRDWCTRTLGIVYRDLHYKSIPIADEKLQMACEIRKTSLK